MYILDDTEKEVVSQACESLQAVLEVLGPQAIACVAQPGWVLGGDETRTQSVFDGVLQLLHEKSPCQLGPDMNFDGGAAAGEEGFEADEDNDHDNILMVSVVPNIGLIGLPLVPPNLA